MQIQVRVVVRTTSASRQAVDADLVLDAERSGSSRARSTNWKCGCPAGVEADQQQRATRPRSRARRRAPRPDELRPVVGRNAITTAPRSGRKVTSRRSGAPPMVIAAAPRSQVRAGHDDQPDRDAQGVVLHPAGLDPAQPAARVPASTRPTPLTAPSMIVRSNHHRNAATRPPIRMNSRSLSSSNHHLLSEARYRNGHAGVAFVTALGPRPAAAPRKTPNRRHARDEADRGHGDAGEDQPRRRCRTAGTPRRGAPEDLLGLREHRLQPLREAVPRAEAARPAGAMPRKTDGIASRISGTVIGQRRLVDLRLHVRVHAGLAVERLAHQPPHVERGHAGDDEADAQTQP